MPRLVKVVLLFAVLLITYQNGAHAKMKVDITHGNTKKISIVFSKNKSNKDQENIFAQEIIKVVKADLIRSGLFEINDDLTLQGNDKGDIAVGNFDADKAISLVTIIAEISEDDNIELKYRLWDTSRKEQLLAKSLKASKDSLRRIAHIISDSVYTRMTGEQGYFDSRILYISEFKKNKKIAIMDQDGANRYYLTNGSNIVLTPRFSPVNQNIVYMSYSDQVGTVYLRNLDDGNESLIGNFSGVSAAPRFSPDSKSILLARSFNGATDIYEVSLKDRKKRRLTSKTAINTSPSYSPDQKRIVFVSDREGSAQLYIMTAEGRKQHRITFNQGTYTTPVWSPRGDWIAFTKTLGGKFYIGVIKSDGSGERLLATGHLVESPTWSPNGRVIMFAKQIKLPSGFYEARLYSIDLTGENERLIHTNTNASDPAWSPLLSQPI